MHYFQKNLVNKPSSTRLKNHLIIRGISVSLLLILAFSCATKEDIEQRKKVEKLLGDMNGQQNITKSLLLKIYNIENSLGAVSGKVETAEHNLELTEQNTIDELKKRVESIEQDHKKYILDTNSEISKIYKQMKQQQSYLDKLLNELKTISGENPNKKRSLFAESIRNYQQKRYTNAKDQFIEIVNNIEKHKLNLRDQALVYHNLGMTFFIQKDYENSQIYFSKLFTKYSKSPLNSSGLYHLGLSFKKQKKDKEASEMWGILSKRYPNSRFTKLAAKEK